MAYRVVEAQSDEVEGDGSVVGDPEDLLVLVRAWEGMRVHLTVYVRTPLPPLRALGCLGDRWLEEADHGGEEDRGGLGVGTPLVAEACKVREVAVGLAVAAQEGSAGHEVLDQENP